MLIRSRSHKRVDEPPSVTADPPDPLLHPPSTATQPFYLSSPSARPWSCFCSALSSPWLRFRSRVPAGPWRGLR